MRELDVAELLSVWERGQGRPSVERTLALLAAACSETAPEALAELSLGERDSRLLALREWTFGPRLASVAACPACGEQLELDLAAARLREHAAAPREARGDGKRAASKRAGGKRARRGPPPPGEGAPPSGEAPDPAVCRTPSGHAVRFRLLNSRDELALAGSGSLAEARQRLVARCVLETRSPAGERVSTAALSTSDLEAVAARITASDPLAELQLALSCPACGHSWSAGFDIGAYFWREIDAWAGRLLQEVHLLAAAYGWREADILALSPWRRRCYLALAAPASLP